MITKHRTGYLRKKGHRFYLEYMVEGRRVKQVLKDDQGIPVTSREAAEAQQKKIMAPLTVVNREEALRSTVHKLEDATQDRQAAEQMMPGGGLDEAWEAYVASVNRPDSGPRTLRGYASQWRVFVEWMKQEHPVLSQLRQVSAHIAEQYAEYLLQEIRGGEGAIVKRAFTMNTFNKHVRVLELVFRVLAKKMGLTGNPWSEITRKTENRVSRRELTVEELNTICNKAEGELQALLVVGIYTGLRLGDCCTLRWAEVDLVRRIILRVPNKTARRKNVSVHIPIHPTLLALLEQTPPGQRTGFVVPGFAGKYRTGPADVSKPIQQHFSACGIQVHKEDTGTGTSTRAVVEVGFHSLRHSFVSLCRQANAPLSVVEAIVGHSNPAMTRHYTHVGDLAAGLAVAALPAIGAGVGCQVAGVRQVKTEKATLTEREQTLVAILGEMTAETWERDRQGMLAMLLG